MSTTLKICNTLLGVHSIFLKQIWMKLHAWMCKYYVKIPFIIITSTLFFMYIVVVPTPHNKFVATNSIGKAQVSILVEVRKARREEIKK